MDEEKDFAYLNGRNVLALLDKSGIKYKINDYRDGDTFITGRHNLLEFALLLLT